MLPSLSHCASGNLCPQRHKMLASSHGYRCEFHGMWVPYPKRSGGESSLVQLIPE